MSLFSCAGAILESGIGSTFVAGALQVVENLCLEPGLSGVVVEVGGGPFAEETSWSITYPSGVVETGVGGSGSTKTGSCFAPTPHPTVTFMPTTPCETYQVELNDLFGDG